MSADHVVVVVGCCKNLLPIMIQCKKEHYIELSCSEQNSGLECSDDGKNSSCCIFTGDQPVVRHISE